ncbi:aminotransferase class III-fold pyridoxal phosphate-dependent enzyme [Shimia ponticola]|uniref:aminotransferase class III-fold pyridoxal phosphate-dependent enzyme n=1 Tax=Shimia ponticola TaxID=2582893 RepID=UPI0011BFD370|nr:aminotransferase class III-fold pyridoxal phosphate-dependent enzyme [Shimia ponticola]
MNDLAQMDFAHALHPWQFTGADTPPMVVSRGEGCYLWDAQGTQYLDAVGGLWCTNVGLGRKDMAQAIAAQAEKLAFSSTFVDMTNDPAAELAARLAHLAPTGINHVHFTTGGSTAIDSAYRMACFVQAARGFKGRTHMVARQHSYHGSTFISMSLGLRNGDRAPEFAYETETIHHLSAPYVYRDNVTVEELVAEFEAKIAEVGAEKIAAFFAEPIQASGGVLVPPEGYLKAMWEVCQRHGILFVADEVVTAFGRLGHMFASETRYGVRPDIICCAKGLSSGYQPIGAMLFSEEIWDTLTAKPQWYTSGFTYSGHPVACAAALKNLQIIEQEGLLENAIKVGAVLQEGMAGLIDLPTVGNVRGEALIACVENVADKETKALLPDELDIGKRVSDAAEARGLLVRPIGHLNVMSPPLILTEDQAGFIVDTLGAAIMDAADGLVREGVRLG